MHTIKSTLISLRMLLEAPNPKDPQDAEVAKMMMEDPERFARVANDWAAKYAGAPRTDTIPAQYRSKKTGAARKGDDPNRCVEMGCHAVLQSVGGLNGDD